MFSLKSRSYTAVLFIAVCCTTAACQRQPDEPTGLGDLDTKQSLRVATLAPALTQMLVDMGLASLLVGVAEHDMAAPAGLPIVGHWQDINTELLLSLKPTHVLTMTGAHWVPQRLKQLSSLHAFEVVAYPSPSNIGDISKIILDRQALATNTKSKPVKCLGSVLNAMNAALKTTTRMSVQLAHVKAITAAAATCPSVLLVIGVNPFMASGPGTVHDQLLSICGGKNAAAGTKVGAAVYDKEKLLDASPEVILILLPNAPALGPIDTVPPLASLRGLSIPAVKKRRVVLINDPLVQLPSSSIARIAVAMAKAIHPELVESIDRQLKMDRSLNVPAGTDTAGSS